MKKPDFSKQAMQQFFLYHTEKIILAVSILLMGLFFWMGYKTPIFNEKTPTDLSQVADRAESHIVANTSWEKIAEFRKGDKSVFEDIAAAEGSVRPSDFRIIPITGAVASTLEPRVDPVLLPVKELNARIVRAPILAFNAERVANDPLAQLPIVVPDDDVSGRGGFGGMGDFDEDMDDEEGDEDYFGGDFGMDDGGGPPPGLGFEADEEEDDTPEINAGKQYLPVHMKTHNGLRPPAHGISPMNTRPWVKNIVCVTGLVDFKEQYKQFHDQFSDRIGYYPDRDKPIYQYVQVERRPLKNNQPIEGDAGKWVDISEKVNYRIPRVYPAMHQLPKSLYPSAPEIVAAENFDPVLTSAIPGIIMEDYRGFVIHPKLAKSRTFPEYEEEEGPESQTGDIFGEGDDERTSGSGALGGGGAGGRGMGMGGLGGAGMGRGGVPGGIDDGSGMDPSAGMGGMGGMGMGMGGRGMGGRGGMGMGDGLVQTRRGSDATDYVKALEEEPTDQYKLVRIFDVEPQQGESYEYRMRLWIGDPNNEDLDNVFATLQGGAGLPGGSFGEEEEGDDYEEEEDEDEEDDMFGVSADGDGEEEKVWEHVAITSLMKDASVRARLDKFEEKELGVNNTTKETVYRYKTAVPKTDAEGKVTFDMVDVLKHYFRDKTYATTDLFLKHCRPTEWSDPVKVTVKTSDSLVVAGTVEKPKVVKIKSANKEMIFDVTEPISEIVASVWSHEVGTRVPTKQKVYRGDVLNYWTPAHILHPLTWQVHRYEFSPEFQKTMPNWAQPKQFTYEGTGRFLTNIKTDNVVVDLMGGGEIPMPRAEKKRHHFPSEALVMNEYGEIEVKNDIDDQTLFRQLALEPDEESVVGKPKKKRKQQNNAFGGRGGFDGDF